jgi:hypothetical protein
MNQLIPLLTPHFFAGQYLSGTFIKYGFQNFELFLANLALKGLFHPMNNFSLTLKLCLHRI